MTYFRTIQIRDMKFEVDKREKVVVVTAKVEKLDALCAPELKGELVLANKEGHRKPNWVACIHYWHPQQQIR